MTTARAKKLSVVIIGIYNVNTDKEVATVNSCNPIIASIKSHLYLQHELRIINSRGMKKKKPAGVLHTDIYMQIEGEIPISIDKMRLAGMPSRGNYIHNFKATDLHSIVFYIAAYVYKKTLKTVGTSPV